MYATMSMQEKGQKKMRKQYKFKKKINNTHVCIQIFSKYVKTLQIHHVHFDIMILMSLGVEKNKRNIFLLKILNMLL